MPLHSALTLKIGGLRQQLKPAVRPEAAALIGTSDLDPAEIEVLQHHPILQIDALQLMQSGVAERVLSALRPRSAEARGWYLHLDLDVAGPEELPGGMTPAPYWPPRHHLIEAVGAATRSVPSHALGLAVYNPALDSDGRGARLGLDMAMAVIDNL